MWSSIFVSSIFILPDVGSNNPHINFTKVLFPDPLDPTIPIVSNFLISNEIFFKTYFSFSYEKDKFLIEILFGELKFLFRFL